VREAEHRGVSDLVELVLDRDVDHRVPVAVHVAPQRRDAVDVAAALGIEQVDAVGALDRRRVLVLPAALLGERMPDEAAVVGREGHVAKVSPGRDGTVRVGP
jgi:hypothetical protein